MSPTRRIIQLAILLVAVCSLAASPALAYQATYDGAGTLTLYASNRTQVIVSCDDLGRVKVNYNLVPVEGGSLAAVDVTKIVITYEPRDGLDVAQFDLSHVTDECYPNLTAEGIHDGLSYEEVTIIRSPISFPYDPSNPCGTCSIPPILLMAVLMYRFSNAARKARRGASRRARP